SASASEIKPGEITFQSQKFFLDIQSAGIARQGAIAADYPMAGHHHRHRIGAVGRSHGAYRLGPADTLGDVAVGRYLPVGNVPQGLPHLLLELGAMGCDGETEILSLAREISQQLLPGAGKQCGIATPGGVDGVRAGAVLKVQDLDGVAIADDKDLAEGAGEKVVIHGDPPKLSPYWKR